MIVWHYRRFCMVIFNRFNRYRNEGDFICRSLWRDSEIVIIFVFLYLRFDTPIRKPSCWNAGSNYKSKNECNNRSENLLHSTMVIWFYIRCNQRIFCDAQISIYLFVILSWRCIQPLLAEWPIAAEWSPPRHTTRNSRPRSGISGFRLPAGQGGWTSWFQI